MVSDFNSPVDGTSCSVIVSFLSCHFLTITFSICPTIAGVLCPHCHHSGSPHVIDVSELSEVAIEVLLHFLVMEMTNETENEHFCIIVWEYGYKML